jgi:hypothetical protein
MAEGAPSGVARGHTGLPPDEAIKKSSMKFDLPLHMSDKTHDLTFSHLQMLDDGITYDDEDDGRGPEDVVIRADLPLARGLIDVQVEVDAISQATTITQLTQATELGGGVHLT